MFRLGLYRHPPRVKDYTVTGALALWPDKCGGDGIVLNGLVVEGWYNQNGQFYQIGNCQDHQVLPA